MARKSFIYCPECGRKICKLQQCSGMEIQCPNCKTELDVIIEDEAVIIKRACNEEKNSVRV